ncbi:MAG: carbohydrate ABC transporter permease [Caldilineaceae bacterium]|nr:carbohydrate ABC transporter permease [Caldilineaceae bacterium]
MARHLVLITVSLLFLIPFWWLIISSVKSTEQILTYPPRWLPDPIHWENYRLALTSPTFPFLTLLQNTLFYTVTSTIGTVVSSTVVAYAFARMRFWGRDVLFSITLATLLLPGVVTLIPTYILFQRLGWVGTYAPLIVPHFFGSAFNIFLIRQFMLTVPRDMSDAARVDGAGDFTILWRVMAPLLQPVLLVVAILHFMYTWNDFLGPLLYVDDASEYTLVIGLYAFRSRMALQWHLLTAAALAITLPLILLFFVAQRYFIEGVTLTGIKG